MIIFYMRQKGKEIVMKQSVIKKSIITLMILVISFVGLSLTMNGAVLLGGFTFGNKTVYNTELLAGNAENFELQENGSFYSNTADPWFNAYIENGVRTIVLDIEEVSDTCNAQVFYYNNENPLNQEHSVWASLDEGKTYIQIPTGNYNLFRLDLADQEGVSIKINSVSFYKHRCFSAVFWIAYFIILIYLYSVYVFIKNYRNIHNKIGDYNFYKSVLAFAIMASCIIVYGATIISGHQYVYYDIGGGDGPESYIPLFSSYVYKLREHTLAEWTWNNGLGTSMSAFWGFIANPCTMIVIAFGALFGMSTINTMVLVVQLLNIFIVGILCYKYLSYFDGKNKSKAIASYIAAFSGYMTLYAQHYVHSEFAIYIFITLILVEEILRQDKFSVSNVWLAIDCALLFICTVYLGYMIGLFTGVYTIFRLMQKYTKTQIKVVFVKLGQILGAAITGVIIAMPFVLAVVNELLFNSDRVNSGNGGLLSSVISLLTIPYHKEAFVTIFFRLLSSNLQGAGNDFWGQTDSYACDYYAAPELFFSVFILSFGVVYFATLWSRHKDTKQRVLRVSAGILVIFVIFNRLGSALFNALVAPFGRYTYLLMPLFAIVALVSIDELEERKKSVRNSYILAGIVTVTAIVCELLFVKNNDKPAYISFLAIIDILLVFIMIVVVCIKSHKFDKFVAGAFAILIFVNVTADSYVTVDKRIFCSFSKDITNQDDYATQDALEFIKNYDDSMYRVEKNYYDVIYYHDAYLQNYRGVSTYNSTLNANVKEFYNLYCNPAINFYWKDSFWYSYMNVTNDIVQDSILGVKYILSNSASYDDSQFEKIYSNDEVSVYKNRAIDSFGIFYENVISKNEILNIGYADRVAALSQAVVLEEEDAVNASNVVAYSYLEKLLDEKEADYKVIEQDTTETEILINDVNKDDSAKSYLEFTTNMTYDNHMIIYFDNGNGYETLNPYYYRGDNELNQQARIALPFGTQKIKFESSVEDVDISDMHIYVTDKPYVPNTAGINIDMINDSHLNGTIDTERSGYLFLPIPFEKGWTINIDGEQADVLQADSGFMAIFLDSGFHNIDIKYSFPGQKYGIICSIFGGTVIIIECVYLFKRKRRYHG